MLTSLNQFNFLNNRITKSYIYFKFNNSNYFFLTNKFFLLNFYYNFFFINNSFSLNTTNISNILIKKNKYFFFKNIIKFRRYVFFYKYMFKFKLKFNFFFKFIFFNAIKKNYNKKNYALSFNFNPQNLYFKFFKIFFKNWNFLIGNPISPYFLDLFSKKKWIRKYNNFKFLNNRLFYRNKRKYLNLNTVIKDKKFIINNFFYLYKDLTTLNYSKLKLNIKNLIKNSFLKKNNYDFFLSRPYLFLNLTRKNKNIKKYSNFFCINLYRRYYRFFNNFKRNLRLYKMKNKNLNLFKNFFFLPNALSKSQRNKNNLNSKFLFNWFSFYKPFFRPKNNFKKKGLYLWIFFFNTKTKILKKNKFFLQKKLQLIKTTRIFRFFKRFKKINFFLKSFYFFDKKNKINLNLFFWFYEKRYLKNLSFENKLFFFNKNNDFYFLWKNNYRNFFNFKKSIFNFFKYNRTSFILKKLKKCFYFTKSKLNFISNRYSFLFLSNTSINTNTKFVYNVKKIIYSFSYKNEIQKFILKKYSRFNSSTLLNFPKNRYLLNYDNFFKSNSHNFSYNALELFLNKKTNANYMISQKFNANNWTYLENQIKYAINNENDLSNFNIKRFKFKPGYMNMWRDARSVLKTSLNLKFKYQYKLTNYLSKYKKFIKFKTFLFMEMRLFNILIKSRLLTDKTLLVSFFTNNLIFLNGIPCSNHNIQVFCGDFIQLVINLKYYILYRWFNNLSLKKKNKLRNVLKKKNSNLINSDEKKRSYSFPKWILFSKNIIDDVSNYLEIDYFTLSIFVIYEPFLWNDLNSYNLIDQRFGIINLYNWKYLT